MRDRTNQRTLDFTTHPKAKEIYDSISGSKIAWVAEAIEEKHDREKGNGYVTKEELRQSLSLSVIEESFGYNGKCITFRLMLDDESISETFITIKKDEG